MSQFTPTAELGPDLPGLRCISLLGSGGYADVYLYERDQPKIRVAVKLMKSSVLDDAKRRQFTAEADTMAELAEHPFIVPVLGAGTAPDGRPYLEMRHYPSSDLAARVAANPMSVADALRYGIQLSSAVETAHRANIIHRDIKPSNILLSSYGQPALSDFGIAGRPGDAGEESEVGVSMPWSPPEVLTGASNGSVTSDIYSLAATVWTLLVGHAPFHIPGGDNSERATFTRILHSRPPATGRGDATASLDRLLQQALAKDPAHRPQSALELARHFQRVEQELRLARTEAVVLDQGGGAVAATTPPAVPAAGRRTDPASDRTVVSNRTPAEVEGAATQRRAPRRIEPVQSPAPEPFLPPSPAAPSPVGAAPSPPTADARRWTTPGEAPPASGPVGPGKAALEAASQPTHLRPRTVDSVQGAKEEAPARGGSRRVLLGAGAAAVLVAIVIVVAMSGGGAGPKPSKIATTVHADTNAGDAVPDASSAPNDPSAISGTVSGDSIVFSWPPVAGISEYSWSVGNGPSRTTRVSHVRVSRGTSGSVCITVHSVAPGYPVSPGRKGCVS